ncbi:MAG: site-specific DNA-methyltransferase [Spirochaetaceae bacterium]|jgi:site-specific DNA-methyltransferase (adenine-specific)|nr:site-specific DNA-methyltransferase [Spirochaetaceae bacterium]
MEINKIFCGDCKEILASIPPDSVDLVITSPPYFQQREYGGGGIGNEKNIDDYIKNIVDIFRQCIRVIKKTGSVVFNIGDKYADGNLLLAPYRFALQAQKENLAKLINELTWVKINPTPKQDPKKLIPATEPFFIFVKSNDYFFNKDAFLEYRDICFSGKKKINGNDIGKKYYELIEQSILSEEQKETARKELQDVILEAKQGKIESFRMKIKGIHALPYGGQGGGRLIQIETKGFTIIKIYGNSMRKDVIESTVETIKGNIHPAVYPEFIVQELIKLLTKQDDVVLDPFLGSGTTALVAKRLGRKYIGIEINREYAEYAERRLCEQEKNVQNGSFEFLL